MGFQWIIIGGKPWEIIEEYRKLTSQGFKVKLMMDSENNPYACKYKNFDKKYSLPNRVNQLISKLLKIK